MFFFHINPKHADTNSKIKKFMKQTSCVVDCILHLTPTHKESDSIFVFQWIHFISSAEMNAFGYFRSVWAPTTKQMMRLLTSSETLQEMKSSSVKDFDWYTFNIMEERGKKLWCNSETVHEIKNKWINK